MKTIQTAGIVAEYNPFHNGHAYMIQQVKNAGYDAVVCVMSGSYVQRAEPALLPPQVRARAAVASGADLVLRLPLPWAVASAEQFAQGAVGLLGALGCVDALAFGAETANIQAIRQVAELLQAPAFTSVLKTQLALGLPFAAARERAVEAVLPNAAGILAAPNNLLGVEYYKAIRYFLPVALQAVAQQQPGASLQSEYALQRAKAWQVLPIARQGTAHDAATPAQGGFASASWLRSQFAQSNCAAWQGYVPAKAMPYYTQAFAAGQGIDFSRWELAMLARLRGMPKAAYTRYENAHGNEGLDARLYNAAQQATSLQGLYSRAKSKRFAHSRVRRLALAAALHLPAQLPHIPPYAHVLAASKTGLQLLQVAKNTAVVPVATSLARLAKTSLIAGQLVQAEAAAEALYALCLQIPAAGGYSFTTPPYIEK